MVKAPLILLLVAAGAVAAAAANKQAKPSFADALAVADPKKAGAASVPSSQYDEVETVETCLKAVSTRNCRLAFPTFHWESGLACCGGSYYNKDTNSFLATPDEVGVCDYTVFIHAPISVKDNINRIASFIATCTMNSHSDECGYPFCDKMVVSVQGLVYAVEDAIVSSLPAGPSQDQDCLQLGDFQREGSQSSFLKETTEMFKKTPLFEGKKASGKTNTAKGTPKAKAAYAHDGPEYEPNQLYKVDEAVVYYGAMTVLSRIHDAKVDGGWFEYSRISDKGEGTEVDSPNGQYVLDPWTYKLSFTKQAKGGY